MKQIQANNKWARGSKRVPTRKPKSRVMKGFTQVDSEVREAELTKMIQIIGERPGITPWKIDRYCGWKQSQAKSLLLTFEERGILLWEDERGGLHLLAEGEPELVR